MNTNAWRLHWQVITNAWGLHWQVITNAGQANAATGDQGVADCQLVAETLGSALGVPPTQVLVMSTGVIGRRIKLEPLLEAIPKIVSGLGASAKDALQAAVAITTTDLVSKTAALEVRFLALHPTFHVPPFFFSSPSLYASLPIPLPLLTAQRVLARDTCPFGP